MLMGGLQPSYSRLRYATAMDACLVLIITSAFRAFFSFKILEKLSVMHKSFIRINMKVCFILLSSRSCFMRLNIKTEKSKVSYLHEIFEGMKFSITK